MPQPSKQLLSQWREQGKWWDAEVPLEFVRFMDEKGIVRETSAPYECENWMARLNTPRVTDSRPFYTVDYDVLRRETHKALTDVSKIVQDIRVCRQTDVVPLHCLSALSFGRSCLTPEQVAALAYVNGMPAVALTDRFSLAGVVSFARAAEKLGIKPIVGAVLEMAEGGELVLLAASGEGYRNLSRLITRCHLEEPRTFPLCTMERLEACAQGLICLTGGHNGPLNRFLMQKRAKEAEAFLKKLIDVFGAVHIRIEIERSFVPWERFVNDVLLRLAGKYKVKAVAGGVITHAAPSDFPAQDALTCVETLCTVEDIVGRKPQRHASQLALQPWPVRSLNAERFFRTGDAWHVLYDDLPELLCETALLAESMPENPLPERPGFPRFCDDPKTALWEITLKGAERYYLQTDGRRKRRVESELMRICEHGFESHFLAVWEMCNWARSKGILHSARGSAVDSAVAYCLGLSKIDAITHNLHFDRFLPADGSKRPDIDIDFEAHRRDEVRGFLSERYGKEYVATVCAVATYQGRGIVRMVGKALMIPEDVLGYLAKRLHGSVSGKRLFGAINARPELKHSGIPAERFTLLFELAEKIDGLPRGIAAHSSGVVISDTPICETVPVMASAKDGVPIIQWDKYSAKYYFDKFDVLCLRGQDVLSGTQHAIRLGKMDAFDVEAIPLDSEETFSDFQTGKLIGTPQSASPAMRQAHVRLQSKNLHDVSLVQAGIRPGVGGSVKINSLIRRRRGVEQYVYPHPLLEKILGMSYGIIVFQEQVDQLLQEFCGYTSGEAEEIRESIHKLRADDWSETIKDEVASRCLAKGFSNDIARHVFELVSGFKGYGFAQGHALAFAELSIRCVYCQQHYPKEYFAALLSNQPAGYYGPGTIANEARIRNVQMLPIDVNASQELFSVEGDGIRVGLIQQHGLSNETRGRILSEREWPYESIFDFCAKARPDADELENMVLSGCFDSLHANRRALLWVLPEALKMKSGPSGGLFETITEPAIPSNVEDFTPYERAVLERSMLSLDINTHLMSFERERVKEKGAVTCAEAGSLKPGAEALVVGMGMRLRFPPTASGRRVVFFDLEDETGLLNVTCFDETYKRDGHSIICSPFVTLKGVAQDRDGHIAFLANRVFPDKPNVDKQGFAEERKAVHAADFITRRGR